MIKIKNFKDALEQLPKEDLPPNLMRDILYQLFIFETQFTGETFNEVIILKSNEDTLKVDYIPEFEEEIDGYHKSLYIVCDNGDGMVVYQELGGNHE